MVRTSDNYYLNGRLMDGYDYDKQAWVRHGKYIRCGHPEVIKCSCYGRLHEGESTSGLTMSIFSLFHTHRNLEKELKGE